MIFLNLLHLAPSKHRELAIRCRTNPEDHPSSSRPRSRRRNSRPWPFLPSHCRRKLSPGSGSSRDRDRKQSWWHTGSGFREPGRLKLINSNIKWTEINTSEADGHKTFTYFDFVVKIKNWFERFVIFPENYILYQWFSTCGTQEAHKGYAKQNKKASKEAFLGRIFGLGGTRRKYNSDLRVSEYQKVENPCPLSKNLPNAHPPASFYAMQSWMQSSQTWNFK